MIKRALLCGSLMALSASACGAEDSEPEPIPTTASGSCEEWQDAFLDFASRCGLVSNVRSLEEVVRTIHCGSDATAVACAEQLGSAECSEAGASGCKESDMADEAAAEARCTDVSQAFCEAAVRCGQFGTVEACLVAGGTGIDCTTAIGWTYRFEECVSILGTVDCNATALPSACEEVITVASGG